MPPPPYRALRAFAETARAGSLAAAARTLNVTPSAVSHLLREREHSLGFSLIPTRIEADSSGLYAGWYARGVGGAAARQIKSYTGPL